MSYMKKLTLNACFTYMYIFETNVQWLVDECNRINNLNLSDSSIDAFIANTAMSKDSLVEIFRRTLVIVISTWTSSFYSAVHCGKIRCAQTSTLMVHDIDWGHPPGGILWVAGKEIDVIRARARTKSIFIYSTTKSARGWIHNSRESGSQLPTK